MLEFPDANGLRRNLLPSCRRSASTPPDIVPLASGPRLQRPTSLEQRFQTGTHARPALADLPLHVGTRLQVLVRDRQAHHVGDGFKIECDATVPILPHPVSRI